ncbi:unnamed protein product [Diamesa tonsa]
MNLICVSVLVLLTISSVIGDIKVPKADQKSLVIIFDGTQSMQPDLDKLRDGVRNILNDIKNYDVNPFFNYILVVFHDFGNILNATQDPEDVLKILDEIEIRNGGNFSEMPLSALKAGMKYALPNSIAYVITDSTAKDYAKFQETAILMIRKKITVNFLLAENCGDPNGIEFKVYNRLARHGNGQVFHIETDGIEKVLMALQKTIRDSHTLNQIRRTVLPGRSFMPFSVDSTITNIAIKISGVGVNVTIKNPLNQIATGDVLTLENLQIVTFNNPMLGKWTIDAESSSEYRIQIESNSKLKFEYGFSSSIPKNHRESSVQPLQGSKNYLTFFVSDLSTVGSLLNSNVTLDSLENEKKIQRMRRQVTKDIVLKLTKIGPNTYTTEPFDAPEVMFKVQLKGVDSTGNVIERVISTAIESVERSAPEVSITASQYKIERHEKLTLKCIVKSLIAVNIQCQSNECDLIIRHEQESNAENYICKAENSKGTAEKQIDIEVKGGPISKCNAITFQIYLILLSAWLVLRW